MLSGSGWRGQNGSSKGVCVCVGGGLGGLWFHYQLIRLQLPSVAPLPLENESQSPLGPFGEKCHNSNGQRPF